MTDAPNSCSSKIALPRKSFVNALRLITDIANEIPIIRKAIPMITRSCQFFKRAMLSLLHHMDRIVELLYFLIIMLLIIIGAVAERRPVLSWDIL